MGTSWSGVQDDNLRGEGRQFGSGRNGECGSLRKGEPFYICGGGEPGGRGVCITMVFESASAESNWENVVTSLTRLVFALVIPPAVVVCKVSPKALDQKVFRRMFDLAQWEMESRSREGGGAPRPPSLPHALLNRPSPRPSLRHRRWRCQLLPITLPPPR